MDSAWKNNIILMDFPQLMHINSKVFELSPTKLGLSALIVSFSAFVAYLAYTPSVDRKAPAFTSDKILFVGSLGFFRRRW